MSTPSDVVKENNYGLPKLNEERIYDLPNENDVMATEKVEITPNPAYRPVYMN